MRSLTRFLLLGLVLAAPGPVAHAQYFGSLQQDARAFVPALEARAMGDAVAAVPNAETAFFYNPAHLARLQRPFRLTVAGAGATLSTGVGDKYAYWRDDLQPAVEEGLAEIRDADYLRLEGLYFDALEVGRRQDVARVTAFGPAFQKRLTVAGWDGAAGAGLFGTANARLRFTDAGAGVPYLDFYSQADILVPVTVAAVVPRTPVAVGLTASYAHRYVTAKGALVETLDPEREHLYVLTGSTVGVDVGVHAQDVLPALVPGLDLGGTVYNLLGGGFTYRYGGRRIDLSGSGDDDLAEVAALEVRFNSRTSRPAVRLGAAYQLPLPNLPALTLDRVTVAADYVSMSTSEYDQPMASHFRLGVEVAVSPVLSMRTGIRQGYPSFGTTLTLPGTQLDYAYFGVEDGREPGQLGRYNHHLRLRFGLF